MISFIEGSSQTIAPTLHKGQRGTAVAALQNLLLASGFVLGQDGIFGSETESVVKQLQAQGGVVPDGVAGPVVWDLIARRLGKGFSITGTVEEYTPATPTKSVSEDEIPKAVAATSNDTLWMIGAGILLVGGLIWYRSRPRKGRR